MKTVDFNNGFYWVIVTDDGNDPEVAELIHGEWYVAGSNQAIQFDDQKVKVLSNRLSFPVLQESFRVRVSKLTNELISKLLAIFQ